MGDLFDTLQNWGDQPAIISDAGQVITYAALAERSDHATRSLPGGRRLLVAIECRNATGPLLAYLGCMRAGHVVLLLPPGGASPETAIHQTFKPDVVFRDRGVEPGIDFGPDILGGAQPVALHPELSLLLSTSGTTGSIKLVRLSRDNLLANARSIASYLEIGEAERAITTLPFHYSYGLSVIHSHLAMGAALLLTDRSVTSDDFWTFARERAATSLAGVPYTYELLARLDLDTLAPPSLRTLTQAGGRLAADLVLKLQAVARARGARFFVMYGQTEATARIAYMPPDKLAAHADCIGVPIPGGQIRLIGADGADIHEPETPGELVYAGPNVMLGYAESREDLARGREVEILKTGDLAVRTTDGLFKIVGRTKRFIKLFGLRINLDEIERQLIAAGHVATCAGDDTRLAVAVTTASVPETVTAWIAERYGLPPSVIDVRQIVEIPRLANDKTDYRALLALFATPRTGIDTTRKPLARKSIRDVYARVFGAEIATSDASFVSLGGSSLTYVEVSIEIEDLLGFLPPKWEYLSLAELEAIQPHAKSVATLDSDVFWRAISIMLVVINHSFIFNLGATAFLLLLAGVNFSRFQGPHLSQGDAGKVLRNVWTGILIPYFLIAGLFMVWKGKVMWPSLLLYANFLPTSGFLLPYWFLCVLAQVTVLLVVLSRIGGVRRFMARHPFGFGLAFYGTALLANRIGFAFWRDAEMYLNFTERNLHLLALGWVVFNAVSRQQRLFASSLLFVSALLVSYANPLANVPLLGGGLMLIWIRKVPLPALARRLLAAVSASSLYIYLLHTIPIHFLVSTAAAGKAHPLVATLLSPIIGYVGWRFAARVEKLARRPTVA